MQEPIDTTPPQLQYPHENLDALPRLASGQQWVEAAKMIGQLAPGVFNRHRLPTDERQGLAFRLINGDIGADVLPIKHSFGELVNELGYQAPRTVYVKAGTSPDNVRQQITEELPERPTYFIKPADGVRGRGTGLFDKLDDLAVSVAESGEDYLVQSDETPQEDWRYVLHHDADDPTRVWRIAYKKIRPQVLADGVSSIADLVRRSSDIPGDRKSKIIDSIGDRAQQIPHEGEITEVAESGNISNGAYGQLPAESELAVVDEFMRRFSADLEAYLGNQLNTMCFDIGIKDTSVFEGEYDFEKVKDSVVFYEFQMPFGVTGYIDELYGADHRSLDRVRAYMRRARLNKRLAESALRNLITS